MPRDAQRRRRALLASLVAAHATVAAGCGVPHQIRTDARLLALTTQAVQQDAGRFAAQRERIAAARTRNLSYLEESALRAEQQGATDLLVWRQSDPGRVKLFEAIEEGTAAAARQREEAAAQREAHARAIATAHGGAAVRSEQLARTAQSLAALAAPPAPEVTAALYIAFFKDVRRQLDESRAAAESQTQEATATAGQKVPTSVPTSAPPPQL